MSEAVKKIVRMASDRMGIEFELEGVELPDAEGWMPIETAPKDGTVILLGHEAAVFDGWWYEAESAWVDGERNMYDDYCHYNPTHWQPLPEPPK